MSGGDEIPLYADFSAVNPTTENLLFCKSTLIYLPNGVKHAYFCCRNHP